MKKAAPALLMLFLLTAAGCQEGEQNAPLDTSRVIWAIEPRYENAYDFSSGLAEVVTSNSESQFINKQGSSVFEYRFSEIINNYSLSGVPSFRYGVAVVTTESSDEVYFLSRSGVIQEYRKVSYSKANFTNSRSLYAAQDESTELWGYFNNQMMWYIEPKYGICKGFNDDGYSFAYIDNEKYSISNSGVVEIADDATEVNETSSLPRNDDADYTVSEFYGKYGIKNSAGEWVLKPDYSSILIFNDYVLLQKDSKYGIYFLDSNDMIEPRYNSIEKLDSVLLLSHDKGERLLNLETKVLSDTFSLLCDYAEGLFVAQQKKGELYGYVDINGDWVIPPIFVFPRQFSEGIAAVKTQDGLCGYIANPLIYSEWSADETQRAAKLELTTNELLNRANAETLLLASSAVIKNVLAIDVSADDLYSIFNLSSVGIYNDMPLTREQAAAIAAKTAEYCGAEIYCLYGFLEDESDVNVELAHYVSYAACFGYFDWTTPGLFEPTRVVGTDELGSLIMRLYENCLALKHKRFENVSVSFIW